MNNFIFLLYPTLIKIVSIKAIVKDIHSYWETLLLLVEEDKQLYWRKHHKHPIPSSLKIKSENRHIIGMGIQVIDGVKSCPIRERMNHCNPKQEFLKEAMDLIEGLFYPDQSLWDDPLGLINLF